MESFLPFLPAAGLGRAVGAVVTTLLSSWLMRRNALDERRFREKKDAYVNLLKAINNSQIERISEAAELVGHWITCAIWSPRTQFVAGSTHSLTLTRRPTAAITPTDRAFFGN